MDIWAWVFDLQRDLRAAGHHRVADLIESIPEDKHHSRPERVIAALPEALAAARALKNPWLEVFFRHWGLSNRMHNLAQGDVALSEAVSLIEFAHRDAHASCPQAVCVTQDLAICYGNIDGPGWAPERLEVCVETLARIDASWPCFGCISGEYAEALLDAGREQEAVVFLARQAQAQRDQGEDLTDSYQLLQARALWRVGDVTASLAVLAEIDRAAAASGGDDDPEERRGRDILRAHIALEQSDLDLAQAVLPAWQDLQPRAYEDWSQAACALARHRPERNTWSLGRDLQKSLAYLSRVGAHFDAVQVALRHAELALLRAVAWTARRALAIAQAHLLKLRQPQELAQQVAALTQKVAALPDQGDLPVAADALLAHLRAQKTGDPERDVEWLLTACEQRPDDAELAEVAASALAACGMPEEARDQLWRFIEAHPEVNGPIYQLMSVLLEHDDLDELSRLATLLVVSNPAAGLWVQAQLAYRQQRWAQACEHLSAYVQADPSAVGARHLWAAAALAHKDLNTALQIRKELVAALESPGDEHWDLLTIASACQDWATVRDVASFLGISFEGESGPIEESWGAVYIRVEHRGQTQDLYAHRTGPVTARILAPSYPPMTQQLDDWVAFDAALLEPRPEDEADRANFIPTFRLVHALTEGGYGESCFVDGASPGEAEFETFRQAIRALGWHCWVTSSDDYAVLDPEGDDEAALPGLHFLITAPKVVSPIEIDRTLHSLTAGWKHPACWPRFAEQAGLETSAHAEIVARYGL